MHITTELKAYWFLIFYLLPLFLVSCQSASIAPYMFQHTVKFSWQVNYKYDDTLHHNLDRVWIVTGVPLAKLLDIDFTSTNFESNCEFSMNHPNFLKVRYGYLRDWLEAMCMYFRPIIS